MGFFNDWTTGRALRAGAKIWLRYVLPIFGALVLVTAIVHALGGPCLLPNSIACSF